MHEDRVAIRRRDGGAADGVRTAAACLVEGCPCKDPRIVSHRRAAFFAAVARDQGETANRAIDPDPEWRLPAVGTAMARPS